MRINPLSFQSAATRLNHDFITEKNSQILLELIRLHPGGITGFELQQKTGLFKRPLYRYLNSFIDKKIIYRREIPVKRVGKRPYTLFINPEYCFGLGVLLLNSQAVFSLIDFSGNCIDSGKIIIPIEGGKFSKKFLTTFAEYFARYPRICGVGISGPLVFRRPPQDPDILFSGFNIYQHVNQLVNTFEVPVYVNTYAESGLLFEMWKHGLKGNIVLYLTSTAYIHGNPMLSLGLSVYYADRLLKGAHLGGNISGLNCAYIKKSVRNRQNNWIEIVCSENADKKEFMRFAEETTRKIVDLVYIFDPHMIILGGDFEFISENFLSRLKEKIFTHLTHPELYTPEIRKGESRNVAQSTGSALQAFDGCFGALDSGD